MTKSPFHKHVEFQRFEYKEFLNKQPEEIHICQPRTDPSGVESSQLPHHGKGENLPHTVDFFKGIKLMQLNRRATDLLICRPSVFLIFETLVYISWQDSQSSATPKAVSPS